MLINPALVADGRWGFVHAGLTIAELQVSDDEEVDAAYWTAYYFTRESIARCGQSGANHLDPITWSEDSRLDYWAVVAYVEWYTTQLN